MFIARQPIINKELKLYGYELLFRPNLEINDFGESAATKATACVLGDLYETGIENITDGKKAFINFDYDSLMSDSIELIDPNSLVIEVLENIRVDKVLIDRLIYLKKRGFQIALDDFVEDYNTYPLVPITDIIKYDIIATPLNSIKGEVKEALKQHKILLAEKVETVEEFLLAKEMGIHLFQGYFFCKPFVISKTNNKKSTKAQYARMISELKKEVPSYQALAEIIETDVNLAYRLMKIIKTKYHEDIIYSIKRALVYMGFKELERWINILMLQELSGDKPTELLRISLIRSKFGEFIAINSKFNNRKLEISMMCLFSTADAMFDQTMEGALSGIELTVDIKRALVNKDGDLSVIYWLINSYEKGEWSNVKIIAESIGIDVKKLPEGYMKSLEKADEILSMF